MSELNTITAANNNCKSIQQIPKSQTRGTGGEMKAEKITYANSLPIDLRYYQR